MNFGWGEHDGKPAGLLGPFELVKIAEFDAEDLMVEKDDGVERLILSRRRDVLLDGEVGKEFSDVFGCELGRVPQTVKLDIPFDPLRIRLLRRLRVSSSLNRGPNLVEQSRLLSFAELKLAHAMFLNVQMRLCS